MSCPPSTCLQDYKTYLDFVLAMENKKEPQASLHSQVSLHHPLPLSQALQYLFRLLDIRGQGYLDSFTLNYFFRVSGRDVPN